MIALIVLIALNISALGVAVAILHATVDRTNKRMKKIEAWLQVINLKLRE